MAPIHLLLPLASLPHPASLATHVQPFPVVFPPSPPCNTCLPHAYTHIAILVCMNSPVLRLCSVHLVEGVHLAALAHGVDAEYLLLACALPCPDYGPGYACVNGWWSGGVKACWQRSLWRSCKQRE
ncbi:hypothetical protein K439DRAFT_1616038 [Ramaria rubella]|nr:hypothetical protein K439DRAFT_1616038 [Ramaria rubella]